MKNDPNKKDPREQLSPIEILRGLIIHGIMSSSTRNKYLNKPGVIITKASEAARKKLRELRSKDIQNLTQEEIKTWGAPEEYYNRKKVSEELREFDKKLNRKKYRV